MVKPMVQEQPLQPEFPTDRIPRSAYVLTACVGVMGANSLVLGPIAPEVSTTFGADVTTVMMATAAFGFGAALSSLFLASRIDRFGAFRMLRLFMALLPVALLVSALAPMVAVLVVAQFAAGLISGVALPAVYAAAVEMAPPGRESKIIGVVLGGWTLSMVVGVSLSAIIADLTHWRVVYGVIALVAVLTLVLLLQVKQRDRVSTGPAPTPFSALGAVGLKPLLFACGAFMTSFYGVYAYLGDYFHHGLGQPLSANGLITLVYAIGFATAISMGGVVGRVGPQRLLPIAFCVVAGVYFLLGLLGHSFVAVLCLLALLGWGNYFSINMLIVRMTATDPTKRGTIMGLHSAVTNLAVFAGTGSFGQLYSKGGFSTLAYTAMVLVLFSALVSRTRTS